jgi:hypothetical protein
MKNIQNEEVKVLTEILFKEHKSLMLSTETVAILVGRSKISLNRDRAEGVGIPCSKIGKGKGSDRARYNIIDIVRFVVSRKLKVMS